METKGQAPAAGAAIGGFRRAERRRAKLKLALTAPTGGGKTFSALTLATGVVRTLEAAGVLQPRIPIPAEEGGGLQPRIAVIDTENDSAALYSERFEFDTLNLAPPYTTAKYLSAIRLAISKGYDFLIVDSGSHQWAGEGGILQRKEKLDQKPGSNSYTNWGSMTPEQEQFKSAILHSQIHMLMTLRSKMDYIIETNSRGKQAPVKVGLAPVQRDGMEYEFATVFDIDVTHNASVSKDRTGLFDGFHDILSAEHGDKIATWLLAGKDAPAPAAFEMPKPAPAKPASLAQGAQAGARPPAQQAPAPKPAPKPKVLAEKAEVEAIYRIAKEHEWSKPSFIDLLRKGYGVESVYYLAPQRVIELARVLRLGPPKPAPAPDPAQAAADQPPPPPDEMEPGPAFDDFNPAEVGFDRPRPDREPGDESLAEGSSYGGHHGEAGDDVDMDPPGPAARFDPGSARGRHENV